LKKVFFFFLSAFKKTKKKKLKMFLNPRSATMTPIQWQTSKEIESEKHARMCTLLAIASVVVVLVLFLPVGCPAYDGGPRTSLASAMHSAVASGSMAHASTNFDGDSEALKKYLEENDCTVIVFAHWCGHCKNLLNMVHDLRSKMPADELKCLITVDADKHPEFVQDNHVKGFPATFTNQKGSGQLTPVALNTQDVLMNCTGSTFASYMETPPAKKAEGPQALNWD
jgi:thiol:disulfide interchange protein